MLPPHKIISGFMLVHALFNFPLIWDGELSVLFEQQRGVPHLSEMKK